jgi:hypothetical protein
MVAPIVLARNWRFKKGRHTRRALDFPQGENIEEEALEAVIRAAVARLIASRAHGNRAEAINRAATL